METVSMKVILVLLLSTILGLSYMSIFQLHKIEEIIEQLKFPPKISAYSGEITEKKFKESLDELKKSISLKQTGTAEVEKRISQVLEVLSTHTAQLAALEERASKSNSASTGSVIDNIPSEKVVDRSAEVMRLQMSLVNEGYLGEESIDGIYGPMTAKAQEARKKDIKKEASSNTPKDIRKALSEAILEAQQDLTGGEKTPLKNTSGQNVRKIDIDIGRHLKSQGINPGQ